MTSRCYCYCKGIDFNTLGGRYCSVSILFYDWASCMHSILLHLMIPCCKLQKAFAVIFLQIFPKVLKSQHLFQVLTFSTFYFSFDFSWPPNLYRYLLTVCTRYIYSGKNNLQHYMKLIQLSWKTDFTKTWYQNV